MKGIMKLPLAAGRYFEVAGGPYRQKPDEYVGVKMAKEIKAPCRIDIPTVDFQTPPAVEMDEGLRSAINCILLGHPLYVGCMGGIGRTGLFLAILAKAFDVNDPVRYVRQNYLQHAVETIQQMQYVKNYEIPTSVKVKIAVAKVFYRFSSRFSLTHMP